MYDLIFYQCDEIHEISQFYDQMYKTAHPQKYANHTEIYASFNASKWHLTKKSTPNFINSLSDSQNEHFDIVTKIRQQIAAECANLVEEILLWSAGLIKADTNSLETMKIIIVDDDICWQQILYAIKIRTKKSIELSLSTIESFCFLLFLTNQLLWDKDNKTAVINE